MAITRAKNPTSRSGNQPLIEYQTDTGRGFETYNPPEHRDFRKNLSEGMDTTDARNEAFPDEGATGLKKLWQDLTGQTAVEEQNEANKELAKYQSDLNQANWEKQNAYNTPSEQMKRLSEAGLNSNLLYSGSSASGNAGSMPGVSVPSYQRLPTGSEKINKIIGILSTAMGVTGGLYNLQAAKEAVNNKLLQNENLKVDIQNKRFRNWQNELQSGLTLDKPNFITNLNPFKKQFPRYIDMFSDPDTLGKYSSYFRDATLEKLRTAKDVTYDSAVRKYEVLGAQRDNLFTTGNQLKLDYQVNKDWQDLSKKLGIMGKFGSDIFFPILQTLLGVGKSKIF